MREKKHHHYVTANMIFHALRTFRMQETHTSIIITKVASAKVVEEKKM